MKSYIPNISLDKYCEKVGLCSIRKSNNNSLKIGVKLLDGTIYEEDYSEIINKSDYLGKEIIRVYSSGHIFLDEKDNKVFLITTEKEGKIQHQFTGGSPLEEEYMDIFNLEDGVYKLNTKKANQNAKKRTETRTGVTILEEYNKKPLVDWVLIENYENGQSYFKLVCLLHYIIKSYSGNLGCTGKENTVKGERYDINNLSNELNLAPNIDIVTNKAIEIIGKNNKIGIITDFSKTLTSYTNPTSWSVFAKSGLLGDNYSKERNEYYDIYHDLELEGNVEKTKEWWYKHMELFVKYGLNYSLIDKIINDSKYFEPRKGMLEFFKYLKNKKIDINIASSGIGNIIERFFKNHYIELDNINIQGNMLQFDKQGNAIGIDDNKIITTLNKYEHNFEMEYYGTVYLLGDDKTDIDMYEGKCTKIGFCEEDIPGYDIYLGKNGNLENVCEIIGC